MSVWRRACQRFTVNNNTVASADVKCQVVGSWTDFSLRMQLLIEDYAAKWYTCCNPVIIMHEVFFPLAVATLELDATPGCKEGAMRRMIQTGGERVGKKKQVYRIFHFSFIFISFLKNEFSWWHFRLCLIKRSMLTFQFLWKMNDSRKSSCNLYHI